MVRMESESLRFSAAAQAIGAESRRMGLVVPGFRSPPRLSGVNRTIRRSGPVVSVAVRGRPVCDVVADMIEGVVVANGLGGPRAVRVRRALVAAVDRQDRHRAA
jgi:hypothetical protein